MAASDQDAVSVKDSGDPREHYIRWGPDSPMGRGNLRREVKYRDSLP